MTKFFNETKGAISIFLIIVLVPMLTVSSILVDMSRVRLAESVADSAGDLTLNTALTNYDAVLKDMYGLFATSQNVDEMFENLEEYYRQCIESAGVDEIEADDYVDQIMGLLRSKTGTDDLMRLNLSSFEVSSPTGGNLANPAILKSQIVEFMKYRAPINLGSGLLEAVKSFKNLKSQNQLIENKNTFYEKQTGVMETLEKAWNEIEDYQFRYAYQEYNGDTWLFPTGTFLIDSKNNLVAIQGELKRIMSDFAQYTYWKDSNYYKPIDGLGIYYDAAEEDNIFDDVWTIKVVNDAPITKKYSSTDVTTVDDVVDDLQIAYQSIQNLKKYIYKEGNYDSNNELYYRLQTLPNATDAQKIYTISLFNKQQSSHYVKALENLITNLYNLQCSKALCKEDLKSIYIKINADNTITTTKTDKKIILNNFIDDQLVHLSKTDQYISMFDGFSIDLLEAYDAVNPTLDAKVSDINYTVNNARDTINSYNNFLQGRISRLENAITYLGQVKTALTDENSEYNVALKAWKGSANNLSSDSMGKNDLSEIERLSGVLTEDKVSDLIKRLTNIKDSLSNIKNEFQKYTVLDKKWLELGEDPNNTTLKNLLTQAQKNSLKVALDGSFTNIIKTFKDSVDIGSPKVRWDEDPKEPHNDPDITKQKPSLYNWLFNNFCQQATLANKYAATEVTQSTSVTSGKDDADASQSDLESKGTDKAGESVTTSTKPDRGIDDYITANNLPSLEWSDAEKSIQAAMEANSDTSKGSDDMLSGNSGESSALGIFDEIIKLVDNMATTVRDDMYIADYIMNMFTYSTFESEICANAETDIGAFESWYTWNEEGQKYDLKEKFNKKELLDASKNLTKNQITPNSNYLYGQEVEYIIYGDVNSTASSYGTIYLIRFALNTIYAFTDAEINNITLSAATAIFGTPPLTPLIPVAKIAMTIALALAESGYDLYALKSGESVPLMKDSKTFKMKPSNAAKAIAGEIITEVSTAAIDKGYDVLNQAIEMTDEELTKLINDGVNGAKSSIESLADEVFNTTQTTMINYSNEAVQTLVDACNNVNLLNMERDTSMTVEEKKAAVIAELDKWLATQSSDSNDAVYEVKKMAVDYIKDNGGAIINELFTKIDGAATAAGEAAKQTAATAIQETLTSIKTKLTEKVSALANQAGTKLNELKTQAKNEIKNAASKGAESLKNTIKDKVGATFGTSSSKDAATSNVVSSLLSWSYSDYLLLFLVIGLIASPESVLLRTADVIELNMQLLNDQLGVIEQTTTEESRFLGLIKYTKEKTEIVPNPEAFKLSNSYTYLNIKATLDVEPLLMTLPLIAPHTKSDETGKYCYQVDYEGTVGY